MMKINTSETFLSIQGEGKYAGVPSYFVRYATGSDPETNPKTLLEIQHECKTDHVVITGGEPFAMKSLLILCESLDDRKITIETAGVIYKNVLADLISISPKTSNSTNHEKLKFQTEVWQRFAENYICQFKFVVQNKSDLDEILEIVEILGKRIAPLDVWLMPEGVNIEQISRRRLVAELAIEHGFNYSPRLQIDLWRGAKGH